MKLSDLIKNLIDTLSYSGDKQIKKVEVNCSYFSADYTNERRIPKEDISIIYEE